MYTRYEYISEVTAILPTRYMPNVTAALINRSYDILSWHARGTLQDNRWYRRFLPSISPGKEVLRLLVPNTRLDGVMQTIVEQGKLDRIGMGAVYSVPCTEMHIGGHFHSSWSAMAKEAQESTVNTNLKDRLSVIQCIVQSEHSEQISRAAINAGAHGPIVHYSEGRGLRDRLGWLRITKQAEKEVLTVVVDNADADNVFKAMAIEGKLHLPGRGFMYKMPVEKGLFNLPSQFDAHQYDANMQQIISAIDHLMGDNHWRDQTVFEVSGTGKTAGLGFVQKGMQANFKNEQVCLSAVTSREHSEQIMDMMLDAGSPGLNINYAQFRSMSDSHLHEGVNLINEYCLLDSIIDDDSAHAIMSSVKQQTEQEGIEDLCLYLQPVPQVVTYLHHPQPERRRAAEERVEA
ncbi:MAG: hypothetical protein GKR91_08015 [Pseudomonadales bacterium]|nr:hypothetical protein [Pseudomonadales bacterium]